MFITPIIVPVNNTKEENCIIQDGVRYCEKKDITPKEVGYIFLSFVAFALWIALWFWISFKIDEMFGIFPLTTTIFGGVILPLFIAGIILVI